MSNNPFIGTFGVIQLILSQIPNFHELSILSIIAAIMSFAYASIGLGLSIAKIAGQHVFSLCYISFGCFWLLSKIYILCQLFVIHILTYAEGNHVETSLTGMPIGKDMSSTDKMWNTYSALGNIAFAYAFSTVLVEIQVNQLQRDQF